MIGSKRKISIIRKRLLDQGWATARQFDRVYAPIGIDIHSETVEEIAISIAAQLVQVRGKMKSKTTELK
jgi:xanthine dehydrogenase accessory factor